MAIRSARSVVALTLVVGVACPSGQVETPPATAPSGPIVAVTGLETPADPAPTPAASSTTTGAPADELAASGSGALTGERAVPPEDERGEGEGEGDEGEGDDSEGDGDEGDGSATAAPPAAEGVQALVRERLPDYEVACSARKSIPCEQSGDLDDDGLADAVVRVKAKAGGAIGLATFWGRGGVDVLGGGRKGKWLHVGDEGSNTEAIPRNFNFLARWGLVAADGAKGKRTGFTHKVLGRAHKFKAPKVGGDGILVDGGDAAAIAYWDGAGWRLLDLGY